MMRDYSYEANSESIGEGWTDAAETIDRWNTDIAPILANATTEEMIANEDEPVVSIGNGNAQLASEWAWNEFCGREAGESDEASQALAKDLLEKLTT